MASSSAVTGVLLLSVADAVASVAVKGAVAILVAIAEGDKDPTRSNVDTLASEAAAAAMEEAGGAEEKVFGLSREKAAGTVVGAGEARASKVKVNFEVEKEVEKGDNNWEEGGAVAEAEAVHFDATFAFTALPPVSFLMAFMRTTSLGVALVGGLSVTLYTDTVVAVVAAAVGALVGVPALYEKIPAVL
jgi:ADP-ribosylglycohydrolase